MANTISDELNRLIQAKAGIKSALEEKGLTIGDSSTLDEYPGLIQEMQTGGGGDSDTSTIIDLIEGDVSGNFVIPNGTTKIKDKCFTGDNNLTGITIPNSVLSIGDSAFMECRNLVNVIIPNSVTSLPSQCFYQCKLSNVIIPNSVTGIAQRCFYNNKLQSVIIGTGTTSIQNYAFDSNNTTLQEIVILGTSPAYLGANPFTNNTSPIFVKNAVVDTYKNAGGNWNNVSTRIQPLAAIDFDEETYTVTALGRDNLELYIDGELIDSSTYTFQDENVYDVTVKSVDPSLGVLDEVNEQIETPGYTGGEEPEPEPEQLNPPEITITPDSNGYTVKITNTDPRANLIYYSIGDPNESEVIEYTGSLGGITEGQEIFAQAVDSANDYQASDWVSAVAGE